jgi:hypothetical protein
MLVRGTLLISPPRRTQHEPGPLGGLEQAARVGEHEKTSFSNFGDYGLRLFVTYPLGIDEELLRIFQAGLGPVVEA